MKTKKREKSWSEYMTSKTTEQLKADLKYYEEKGAGNTVVAQSVRNELARRTK